MSTNKISLATRSKPYKPFHYPEFIDMAVEHEAMHWVESEVDLTEDMRQWSDGTITDGEKSLVIEIMKTFTQSDEEVSCGYMDKFIPYFKNNEVRQMLMSFASREGTHQRAYALFTDTLGLPESIYSVFLEHQEMSKRIELMTGDMDMTTLSGVGRALARTVISEGIALFGAFAMLLNFQREGKLMGLCKINEWSIMDEMKHVEGMVLLFNKFVEEHPRIVNDSFKKDIYTMFREGIELEDVFIDLAFQECPEGLTGLTQEDMKNYIRYIADRRLIQMGLKGNFKVKTNPLPWIDSLISGDSLTNFFEGRVTDYSAAGLEGEWFLKKEST